jgi:transposase-like protein
MPRRSAPATKKPKAVKPNPKQRRYSEEEQAEALALYREHGPHEAGRRSGIPHRTISRWARARGVSTDATAKTADATAAARARIALKRQVLKEQFLDTAAELLRRVSIPHVEVKVVSDGAEMGSHAELVETPLPTAAAAKAYVIGAATALDKVRLEEGEVTDRREVHVDDARERLRNRLAEVSGRAAGPGGAGD